MSTALGAAYALGCRFAWAGGAALFGVACAAYAQAPETTAHPVASGDTSWEAFRSLLEAGGLPGALAAVGWWLRGILSGGIPVVISLSTEDRAELRRLRRALGDQEGGS